MSAPTDRADGPDVLLERDGRAARAVLNRPRALNALTHGMVRVLDAALADWERDDSVAAVVLTGAGERGLCAGGDIRSIYDDARAGGTATREFWRDEYRLNARIAGYPKPYVAVMDGIVMGGGVGVSAHAGVRVVTERSRIAMPETGIGFVPDVGGTRLLSRAPGELGTHLALTAAPVGAGDAVRCGLADHYVPADRLAGFTAELARSTPEEALAAFAEPVPAAELDAHREWIDACYAADTAEEIVDRLRTDGRPEALAAAGAITAKSPTAVKVALASLRRARTLDTLEQVLVQEYRVSCAALSSHDLVEGIRAQVVDKDRSPRWSPPELSEVAEADVLRHFEPLGDADDLDFEPTGTGGRR
ncbi:enoyl-CoA hydratase/isomerase family protein [Nocardiopsis potens]|uniref:enoyl-CoA hydratase/isomerase family protein n=1 Tax=Nocardiopsis potens TaxID=1246458 RepID=UPI000592B526|nr:enoyl-CoA hydratase/isomerase family protein [Nocardiopsis potens]